jgi:hypothetical protein
VPAAAYVWLVVIPVPVFASPKFQLYVAPAWAVEVLASKLHVSAEQLKVKFATGGCGVADMNPV